MEIRGFLLLKKGEDKPPSFSIRYFARLHMPESDAYAYYIFNAQRT